MSTRWQGSSAPRGDDYDARWQKLAASGQSVHGEADLLEQLLNGTGGTRVLDAGCGTGRVAIELAARGFTTVGVDSDPEMLAAARAKAPELTWIDADLSALGSAVGGGVDVAVFDLVAVVGNVMIFLAPGTEEQVVHDVAARLVPGGLLVAGFSLRPGRLQLDAYDRYADAAGLRFVARWATWQQAPFTGGDYAVSVHRK
ncbi:MAG: class I SAM-dependent methyltransferase [Mycobacterium sp.]